jgi:hypothetical protein
MGRPAAAGKAREHPVTSRFTDNEAHNLALQAAARGFGDRSSYIRHLVRQDGERIKREKGTK